MFSVACSCTQTGSGGRERDFPNMCLLYRQGGVSAITLINYSTTRKPAELIKCLLVQLCRVIIFSLFHTLNIGEQSYKRRISIVDLKVRPQGRGEAGVVPRCPLNLSSDAGCLASLLFFRAETLRLSRIKPPPQGHRCDHQFMELDFAEPIVAAPTSIFTFH